jgi:catechol 2,3-dioxygenase-like lactoylglutathione lyase family enzyme
VYSSNPPTITRHSRSDTVKTWAQLEPWGGAILKRTDDKSGDRGLTVSHVAEKNTEWFSPSPSSLMINYHIDNMAEMLAELQRNGVEILKGPESDENGTFAWILDPDGNKVELWEPMPWDENNKAK